ncbi:T9SS type A sorting domain-containing protein [Aureispira sp. CCB-E]|uniref:DUF7619 domain-containing protein n=1 Tax=Aureispira sp. CCB-E TaxID=3051121 RepID=UPI0028687664|nr:T9SS type A sorting domain-containing protein [Aureispira sp. CCB-E]WMX12774.1 T9SS type A sorting domain-containing protein [Aureispira sp. CCB-E]
MQNNKLLLLLITCFWCVGGIVWGQCPNSYTINTQGRPTCATANNGSINASGTTYYSGSTYIWNTGATNRYLYNLPSGHYSVTVTDPTNCTYTATTYLAPSPTGITVNPSFSPCNGILYANPSWPASHPFTYVWSDGSTQESIQNPAPGVYTVTVTDANGCTGVGTKTVTTYPPPMSASHTTTPATCNANDGSIDLTVTGGVAPYTFYWNGVAQGQTVEDPINVPVGAAGVSIRDANNCYLYYTLNVDGPQIEMEVSNMSCGQINGSITVNTQNLSNPTFLWSTGATTPTISNLSTGGYSVTVTDGSCVLTGSGTISDGGNVTAYIVDSTQNPCVSDILTAYGNGGASTGWNPPYNGYTYLWNTGETTPVINVQSGVALYIVTITDVNGCSGIDSLWANSLSNGLSLSSVVTDATCGNSDGAIDLTVSNGTAQSFYWSPTGATTEDLTGIAAGFHIVEVRNWSGCVYSDTIPVGEFIEFSSTNASCGQNNGSATVHDYGMTSPTFSWSNGATTPTINNLSAGMYIVTVTNGSCVIMDTVDILDAGQIVAGITAESACQPDYLTAAPTDGAAPYTYLWGNGATDQSILNVVPGNTYDVTITDSNGCADATSYTVPNPPAVTATYTIIDATCNNKNGGIDLTMTGGALPYNYQWSYGNANVKDLFGIYPGQYSVSITDNNGCELEINNMVVGGQTNITVSRTITQPNASNTGGAIDITVSGVNNPTFLWSNGATTEDISNLSAGWYTVSITDPVTGCVFDRDYHLSVTSTNIVIRGYVYDVSGTGTCQTGLPLPYEMVRLQPLGLTTFTNAQGRYTFNISTPGTYTVEYINTSPLTTTVICPTGGTATVNATASGYFFNNFYLTNPPVQDLEVDLWDYSNATPGFSYYTRIDYCNKGNIIMNGTLEYDYNSLLGFESITGWGSTLTFHDIPGHKFYWSFSNLNPGACRSVDVKFTVPTNMTLGTLLQGTADVLPLVGDATPANNTDGLSTTVVGSWDPNDKQVAPYHSGDAWNGGIIYTTDEELEYNIRFQNTGTAPAHFVIIRDTLDVNLLPETIRDIKTKHNAEVSLENGNILVFTFNNIYLPDSATDFDASMGFVKFKIKRIAGLPVGTQIENTAAIYFDYNEPVITNTPISIIDQFSSVVDIDNKALKVETMPNPFERGITLKYTLEETSEVTIRVMNSIGQCVHTHIVGARQAEGVYIEQLNMEDLPSGMYLLNVETSKAITTTKIVKR